MLDSRSGDVNHALKSKKPTKKRRVEVTSTIQELFDKLEFPLIRSMEGGDVELLATLKS